MGATQEPNRRISMARAEDYALENEFTDDKTCPGCREEFDYKLDPHDFDKIGFAGFDGDVCIMGYYFVHE